MGNWATRNHHGTPIASSTERSSVNSVGNTEAPAANTAANSAAATVEKIVTRHATAFACGKSPAPSAAPTSDCAAIASESSTSARKLHSCKHHLVSGDGGRTEPCGDRGRRDEAGLERQGPHQQVAAHHDLRAQHREVDSQRYALDEQRPAEQQRPPTTARPGWRLPTRPTPSAAGRTSHRRASGRGPPTGESPR